MPSTINAGETVNGSCTVVFKDKKDKQPYMCRRMKVVITAPKTSNTCCINNSVAKDWLVSGCKEDFTVKCSKGNISFEMLCFLLDNHASKTINGKH